MIAEGFAHEYTYDSNPYKYQAEFKEAERTAREQGKGFWGTSTCNGNTIQSASTSSPAPTTPTTQPSDPASTPSTACTIKGNISSSGEKIYHVLGGSYYDKTVIDESKGERWFCSESDAQAAGWRRSMR